MLVTFWIYGVPLLLIVWAVLRLTAFAPARVRYAIAVAGFLAVVMVPLVAPHYVAATEIAADTDALTMVWIVVALLLLVRDAIGHRRLRAMRRRLAPAPEEWKRALAWPARVPLLISTDGPFTSGWLRPAVALPAGLAVRSIAEHELSHARWRDPLVFALLRAIAAIFWISPVWLALRWVRREREAAADACALHGAATDPESYVAMLLRLARPSPATAMAASDLEYRARRILAPRRGSWTALVALAIGALLLAYSVPLRFVTSQPDRVVIRQVVIRN